MKPWVALPGACRLSSVTSARQPVEVAVRDPLHRPAVELRVRAVRAELARAAELEREVPGADDRDALVARPRLDQLADASGPARRTASAAAAAARRCWCRSARSAGRPAGRSVMIGQVIAVVDAQLVAERQVEAGVQAVAQDVRGQVLVALAAASAAARTRAPRCTSWRRRPAPCRPGTAACCRATAGGSGRCRPSRRTSGRARVSVSRKRSILATHSSANGGRSSPADGAGPVVERVVRRGDDRDDLRHAVSPSGVRTCGSGRTRRCGRRRR